MDLAEFLAALRALGVEPRFDLGPLTMTHEKRGDRYLTRVAQPVERVYFAPIRPKPPAA